MLSLLRPGHDFPFTASGAAGESEMGDLVFASLLAKASLQLDLLEAQEMEVGGCGARGG